ncbi:hypothetical protein KIH39_09140 [Telmatocola sphagniphila]|uniref:Uncharacterized protein n=1 Tax=Telmatocola sphagniphila TaxID=1123043 RepID=A0A8E6B9W0_9BACT|nr:hypothetical protein [Telmatocola sphagniphila]QVL34052.1 hypothetical protein KIH39_09140 [Telmatocola sphagniphila]
MALNRSRVGGSSRISGKNGTKKTAIRNPIHRSDFSHRPRAPIRGSEGFLPSCLSVNFFNDIATDHWRATRSHSVLFDNGCLANLVRRE